MVTTKSARQELILQLIAEEKFCSLSELQEALKKKNVSSDISTLSRDIGQLRIGKKDGFYQLPDRFDAVERILPARRSVFRQFILSYEAAGNFLVIRTLPGSANAVGVQLDMAGDDLHHVGCIAGDDTVFVLFHTEDGARRTIGWLDKEIRQRD